MDSAHPPRDFSQLQKPLEQFRARTKRLRVHPLERVALWLVGAHLVFLPWALGGMRFWGQLTSLGLAVAGFAIALLPRTYTEEHTGSNRFRLHTWPRLLKFPVFWIGLALLGYVALQLINPAWQFQTDGKGWWMQKIPHHSWLPRGVEAPVVRGGPVRMLCLLASAWLTVCTVWVAFTRRRTLQTLFILLSANGLLLALFGLVQRMFSNGKMFWFWTSPNPSFFSSFIYKNHAGGYLLLVLAVTCGLAAWFYLRGLRRLEKSNPSGLFAFFATCIAVSVLTSYARGATLVMLVFLFGCIAAYVLHQILTPGENRRPVVTIVLVLIFGFFLKTGMEALRTREAWDRLRDGIMREDLSLEYREKATRAALEMLGENWQAGVGAGSFRYLFPIYQHRHPDLVANNGSPMFWEHAHNDVVQFPIELGLVGAGLILAAGGFWINRLLRSFFWENPLSAAVVFGALLLVVYAWWDFPFQCPAILVTWCALWAATALWTQFEEAHARG